MPEGPAKKKTRRAAKKPRQPDGLVRIQKVMASAGIASRRACEQMVEEGLVSVNGQVVASLPVLVDPVNDRIEIDGRPLKRMTPRGERPVYVMLYKPRHTVSTSSDPEGRRTVTDLVEHPTGVRLYPVGRLDYDTMGLVLLTNDGDLANKLTHPRYGVHKTYRAIVRGVLSEQDIAQLQKGIVLATRREGKTVGVARTGAAEIKIVKREPARTIIDITLDEGRNRQVRRMLAKVGCPVKKLVRIRLGPLALKGISMGHWRELAPAEVAALRRAVRERPATGERRTAAKKPGARSRGPSAGQGRGPAKKGRTR